MIKIVDKQVDINLYPFRRSPFMTEAFSMAAKDQGWEKTEIELVVNQTKELSLDERYILLKRYCTTYGEDASFCQEDVCFMLLHLGHIGHYLGKKSIDDWDEYDWSNYNSLKLKATQRIRRVFGLFADNVDEKDKYDVDSPPSTYYNTKEEALEAVPAGQELLTNIYALWIEEKPEQ